jgi:hypothetical protein
VVEFHSEALVEYNALRDARVRKKILTVTDFLRQLGPKLAQPHMKPVSGRSGLFELRPGGGQTKVRPLYFRHDGRMFKVVAIAPEAVEDPAGFARAVARAADRASRDYGVEL